MQYSVISEEAIIKRNFWINKIRELSGNFGVDSDRLEIELTKETVEKGTNSLIDHLRLCGNIPECYGHDTSEEKLYSKYTDILLSLTYKQLGLNSIVLKERADAADVEVFAENYSFVADAKTFRLSRTAKNPKDFKIQAMDNWKRGKAYAMLVCPVHQLPDSLSQIYLQASTRNICIFTYSHLALLSAYSEIENKDKAQILLEKIFRVIPALNPSKSATDYWLSINKTILAFSKKIETLWNTEKAAAAESTVIAKNEALTFLTQEREKIMRMTHEEALKELIKIHKIDNKIKTIHKLADNKLFSMR
ncbi:MAG: HindIII family type II restriction endonuclease [Dysgonamonadaceae bacterium]|jgi:type II restriction enzyme|nr:HindIII family type II restriction endonuclease [Dysgonamonadaceae bacterium]